MRLEILTIFFGICLISFFLFDHYAFGSPTFSLKVIRDDIIRNDWIDLTTQEKTQQRGLANTNIHVINYFSNGKTLNSTIWLSGNVYKTPLTDELTFAMAIDADANENTGIKGVDFVSEIKYKKEKWFKVLRELSSLGESRIVESQLIDFEDYFNQNENFVSLSTDLEQMGSPENYKVLFFIRDVGTTNSGEIVNVGDFTDWIQIPISDFVIFTEPSSLSIRSGEESTVEVLVESLSGFEPEVTLSTRGNEELRVEFIPSKFNIPPYGLSSTKMKIIVPQDLDQSHKSFYIHADAEFPREPWVNVPTPQLERELMIKADFFTPTNLKGQTISKDSRLTVEIEDPIPLDEQLLKILERIDLLMSVAVGAGGGYLIKKIKEKYSGDKDDKKNPQTKNNS